LRSRRDIAIDIAAERIAVCLGDRAAVKVCISQARPMGQQIFKCDRAFRRIRFAQWTFG
jgi:hypothetical protein